MHYHDLVSCHEHAAGSTYHGEEGSNKNGTDGNPEWVHVAVTQAQPEAFRLQAIRPGLGTVHIDVKLGVGWGVPEGLERGGKLSRVLVKLD